MRHPIQLGIDRVIADQYEQQPQLLAGRLGLLMNQASVTGDLQYSCDALAAKFPGQLKAIFAPQHGVWGEQQANMIESDHAKHPTLDIPLFSLYSETRRPTPEMLDAIDCLVIDVQDVGTRVYTFIWTVVHCLEACAEQGKRVVILDRPNPVGGEVVEGPLLQHGYESFVGEATIPLRHGLTVGELARLCAAERRIDVELEVVPMLGWQRSMLFHELDLNWIWPSPNMPTETTTVLYPGQVLLEGVNLSEGRGTTRPFEVAGAPFLDPWKWCQRLAEFQHPGLQLRPTRFMPTFDKWVGQSCGGIELVVKQAHEVRSVATTCALIATAAELAPESFEWLPPPYEYEFHKPPIDILFGSAEFRKQVDARSIASCEVLHALLEFDVVEWKSRTGSAKIY